MKVKAKERMVRKAVKRVAAKTKHTVKREPAVVPDGIVGVLMALLTWVGPKIGLRLTVTEVRPVLTAVPGLHGMLTHRPPHGYGSAQAGRESTA